MKLEIKRETEEKKGGFWSDAGFIYKLSVKLFPSDVESQLFQKYNYSDNELSFLDEFLTLAQSGTPLGGPVTVTFNSLIKGCTWEAKELYVSFTQIPTVIRKRLEEMKAELRARESWHGRDEEIEI